MGTRGRGFSCSTSMRPGWRRLAGDFGGRLEPGSLVPALDSAVARCRSAGLPGPLKLRVLVDHDFRLLVESEPVSPMPDILTAALAPRPLGPNSLLWRKYKTTNRRVYEDNRAPGVDQTIYYNEKGELTESTSMTLVWKRTGFSSPPAWPAVCSTEPTGPA